MGGRSGLTGSRDGWRSVRAISTLTPAQVRDLHRLYAGEWWTRGRSLARVRRMLAGSDVVIAAVESRSGRLVGFARALTDGTFKALVFDVIVSPRWRRRGLGNWLMRRVLAHPRVAAARHVELYCRPGMTAFYRQFGFVGGLGVRLLRREAPARSRRRAGGTRGQAGGKRTPQPVRPGLR